MPRKVIYWMIFYRPQAYMLYGGGGKGNDTGGSNNQFKTSVIDTIVAEVQNTPGEDRCVLLLGYKHQMLEMFQVRPEHPYLIGCHLINETRM
jgi:hypothetical protein